MTMDSPTPGQTPGQTPGPTPGSTTPTQPPTWTPDPVPGPPANPIPPAPPAAYAPTSFAPAPVAATTTAKNRASTGTALLLVGALVAIGGVAFAVGRVTAPTATASPAGGLGGTGRGAGNGTNGEGGFGGFGGGAGGAGGFGGGAGRGTAGVSISGTVVSIDGSTIQIKLANGTTETLNLSPTVTYRDSTTGTAADVTAGATVQIGLALGAGTGPTASGQPRPSGGFGGLGGATVGTITVVK
jgi:hypothetical protein